VTPRSRRGEGGGKNLVSALFRVERFLSEWEVANEQKRIRNLGRGESQGYPGGGGKKITDPLSIYLV